MFAKGAIALLGLLVIAATGCGDKTVDAQAVEQGIKQQVVVGTSAASKVACPDNVKAQKGATFKCDVTFDNGSTGKVEVTQTSVSHYKYALVPGSLQVPGSAAEKQVEQVLTQQGLSDPSVNCPDNIIVKVGTYVVCDVTTASGHSGTVKFTFESTSGTVDTSSVETTG